MEIALVKKLAWTEAFQHFTLEMDFAESHFDIQVYIMCIVI